MEPTSREPSADPVAEAAGLLQELWRQWFRLTRQEQGADPLSLEQYLVLRALTRHGPMTVSGIAQWVGTSVSAATVLTQRMARDGLVSRRRGGPDSRVVFVQAQPEGIRRMAAWDRHRQATLRKLVARLEAAELAELVRTLRRLTGNGD
ncbi:MAG: MarR family transcriptional regulator [Firmicutes bacterium]|nr:MarR family transcriptional regulator [Bacillota bacterium]